MGQVKLANDGLYLDIRVVGPAEDFNHLSFRRAPAGWPGGHLNHHLLAVHRSVDCIARNSKKRVQAQFFRYQDGPFFALLQTPYNALVASFKNSQYAAFQFASLGAAFFCPNRNLVTMQGVVYVLAGDKDVVPAALRLHKPETVPVD